MAKGKFTVGTKETVIQAVRKRSKQIAAAMTDQQFFTSDVFLKFIRSLTENILRKHRIYSLTVGFDEAPSAPIAYTDGKTIYLNAANSIVRNVDDLYHKFCINIGILMHECAHKLFLDFYHENKAINQLSSGELYGNEPNYLEPKQMVALDEIKTALKDPRYNGIVVKLYQHLSNVISDGHDENLMKQEYPGFVAQCIDTAGETQYQQAPTLEETAADLSIPAFQNYFAQFLLYAKLGKYKLGNETAAVQEYMAGLDYMVSYIDTALHTEDYSLRYECLTCILAYLWDSIRQLLQQQSSGDSGSQSGSGSSGSGSAGGNSASGGDSDSGSSANQSGSDPFSNMTPEEAAAAIANAIEQASGTSAPAPENCKSHPIKQTAQASGQKGKGGTAAGQGNDSAGSVFQQLSKDTADNMAASQIQHEMDDSLRNHLRSMKLPAIHSGIPVRIIRHHSCNDPTAYLQIQDEVLPLARNMANEMKALLRELNEEHLQRHKRFGPIIEAGESYRPDGTFFAKKKLPEDLPNMAIAVLLDGSGSMGGERIEAGKKAMVLLERFAHFLNIPCMISSHSYSSSVNLHIYSDFASAMHDEDRKCLGDIHPTGCNHDGIPVRLVGNLLAERPEQVKLFIVISDGTPNGRNYQGEQAMDDIKTAVRELSHKGVLVYGAAIGSDADVIRQMYGNGFLDLTDLARFPKTLIKLVRSRII